MIIYKATNIRNGKVYIGQTKFTLDKRRDEHIRAAERGDIKRPFYFALRKYGIESFCWEVLERTNTDGVDQREAYWIKQARAFYPEGYNLTLPTDGMGGYREDSELTRTRRSAASKGRKWSPEANAKRSATLKARYAREGGMSDTRKQNMRDAPKLPRKPCSEAAKIKISNSLKRRYSDEGFCPERALKISITLKNRGQEESNA